MVEGDILEALAVLNPVHVVTHVLNEPAARVGCGVGIPRALTGAQAAVHDEVPRNRVAERASRAGLYRTGDLRAPFLTQ
jgi:hypothetical protein